MNFESSRGILIIGLQRLVSPEIEVGVNQVTEFLVIVCVTGTVRNSTGQAEPSRICKKVDRIGNDARLPFVLHYLPVNTS